MHARPSAASAPFLPGLPSLPGQWFALCLLVLLVTVPAAFAESDDPWYQIEVLVFEQGGAAGVARPQLGLQLSYPGNWRQLTDPDAPPNPLLVDQESDEPPRQTAEPHLPNQVEAATLPEEQPFTLLPTSERRLNGEARTLERSSSYRVLYHQAWRQPLGNRASTAWILIRGGQQFGEHHELEGTLRIYLQRALFAQANLWKTRFRLQQYALEDGEAAEPLTLPPWPARFGGETPLFENLAREAWRAGQNGLWRDSSEGDYIDSRTEGFSLYDIERIAALNQTQRLELGDTLYLDHPELGVLIHVTRYQRDTIHADEADDNGEDMEVSEQ